MVGTDSSRPFRRWVAKRTRSIGPYQQHIRIHLSNGIIASVSPSTNNGGMENGSIKTHITMGNVDAINRSLQTSLIPECGRRLASE